MRKQKKYHYIYKTTNPKGRYYIGAHSTNSLEDGYMGSGLLVKSSIRAHGKENHKFEILEFCPDRQSLFEREAELVPIELMNDPLCMNLCKGGNGGWDHLNNGGPEHLARCSRGARSMNKITALRIKEDPEFRKLLSEHLIKISCCWTGRTHSEKTKMKMSNSSKGIGAGNKNSQFGTCWVFKGIAKKIKKEELDSYLSEGWIRGRK